MARGRLAPARAHGPEPHVRSASRSRATATGIPFTRAQVETVVRLVGVLTAMFELESPWIAGHEHIAPDRKNDPGALFPWNEVVRRGLALAQKLSAQAVRRAP